MDWLRRRLRAGRPLRTTAIGEEWSSCVLSWKVWWEGRWQSQCEGRINLRGIRRIHIRKEKLEIGDQDYVKASPSGGREEEEEKRCDSVYQEAGNGTGGNGSGHDL